MATISGATGNLIRVRGAYTQPLVNRASSLPRPGQFAGSVASLTGANNVRQPSVVARPGQFSIAQYTGANQVQAPRQASIKIQAAPVRQPVIIGGGGVRPAPATQADGQLGGQFGDNPVSRALVGVANQAANFLTQNNISPTQVASRSAEFLNRNNIAPTQIFKSTPDTQRTRGLSTAALTGANNARYTYQGVYQPNAEQKRREQITQLTAPYQGSVAALTGANMIEPANTGFPGTDPRQTYPVSSQYLTGVQPQSLIGEPAPLQLTPDTSGYSSGYSSGGFGGYGYGGGYGGSGGGGSYGGSRAAAYQNSLLGRVLGWRVATG